MAPFDLKSLTPELIDKMSWNGYIATIQFAGKKIQLIAVTDADHDTVLKAMEQIITLDNATVQFNIPDQSPKS